MINVNKNFSLLENNYIFTEVNQRRDKYQQENKDKKLLQLGVGDVSLPLPKKMVKIMQKELKKQCGKKHFRGYPPENGYDFLKNAIVDYYKRRNVILQKDEIFISNGAGCDVGNLLDLFGLNKVVIQNPTYPAYYDSSIIAGNEIILLSATKENNYILSPDELEFDSYLIYLCSPNNPTGATFDYASLKKWVDFANKTKSIIIFDCAYESFIEDNCPHFIYEIEGAKNCAIEIASFSKTAGFTGIRCSYSVFPKNLNIDGLNLNSMWNRRQCTKFNGVPYFIQKGACYALSSDGILECKKNIITYKENAFLIKQCLKEQKYDVLDTNNSPYVWFKCPNNMSSWEYFDYLLNEYQIVGIPGIGFGSGGENYFRFSGFAKREDIVEAIKRIKTKKIPPNYEVNPKS